jgi:8-oxo-dGTP pyrophosphatase MutT (NUDIX family)
MGAEGELLRDEPAAPEVTSSETVFEGAVWNVVRDTVDYNGSPMVREYVIQQYRHPIRSRDWELPAGLLDAEGESKLDAAKRELMEEADLQATTWDELVSFHTSPGGNDEMVTVYRATGVSATEGAFDRSDEEADIVTRWVSLDEVVEGVLAGRLHNSILSIAALAAVAAR